VLPRGSLRDQPAAVVTQFQEDYNARTAVVSEQAAKQYLQVSFLGGLLLLCDRECNASILPRKKWSLVSCSQHLSQQPVRQATHKDSLKTFHLELCEEPPPTVADQVLAYSKAML
jgi:hypothetical protein